MAVTITTVVCIEQGRRFHGSDLREELAAIAHARIDKAAASTCEVIERLEAQR